MSSLYAHLGLTPAADDAAVAAAVADLAAEEATGRMLTAEERYALETLRSPEGRNAYDHMLEQVLDRAAAPAATAVAIANASPSGNGLRIVSIVSVVALVIYAVVSYNQEQARKEVVKVAKQAAEKAAAIEAEIRQRQIALEREASTGSVSRQPAPDDGERQVSEREDHLRQFQAEQQAMERHAQLDLERLRAEERKLRSAKEREEAERQRLARDELERANRAIAAAERELCLTARANNNQAEVLRRCR